MAARAGRSDRTDHRPADGRATRRLAARTADHARRRHPGQAGRAVPTTRAQRCQARGRGVRLVITSPALNTTSAITSGPLPTSPRHDTFADTPSGLTDDMAHRLKG